jgi:hypothetical protein
LQIGGKFVKAELYGEEAEEEEELQLSQARRILVLVTRLLPYQ